MTTAHRIAIITGTSSSIGAVLAEALLRGGWQVIGIARRAAAIEHDAYRHLTVDG